MVNPQTDKLVRRTTMVATLTASYFLLTADYGSEPNVLDPSNSHVAEAILQLIKDNIKKVIVSAENTVKEFIFGTKK